MPITSRWAPVKTETATGTFCRLCSRFSAVTTISVTLEAPWLVSVAAALAAAVAARPCPAQAESAPVAHVSSNSFLVKFASHDRSDAGSFVSGRRTAGPHSAGRCGDARTAVNFELAKLQHERRPCGADVTRVT